MNTRKPKLEGRELIMFIFECVMSVFYVALGVILLFTACFNTIIADGRIRLGLGIAFGIYGIYRIFRAKKKLC